IGCQCIGDRIRDRPGPPHPVRSILRCFSCVECATRREKSKSARRISALLSARRVVYRSQNLQTTQSWKRKSILARYVLSLWHVCHQLKLSFKPRFEEKLRPK